MPEPFAATVDGFKSDSEALHHLVADAATDLLAVIPNSGVPEWFGRRFFTQRHDLSSDPWRISPGSDGYPAGA